MSNKRLAWSIFKNVISNGQSLKNFEMLFGMKENV